MNLTIGSGDVNSLLSDKKSKSYQNLWRKFIGEKPFYNALSSPIDALRTGSILEDRYIQILPYDFYPQVKVQHEKLDVLVATLDFAKFDAGKVVDFEETKTMFFPDFAEKIMPLIEFSDEEKQKIIKQKFKNYYNQVQFQLLCSNIESATLTFISVYSYEDEDNYHRDILSEDVIKFRIHRDESVINEIIDRAKLFQLVKNDLI